MAYHPLTRQTGSDEQDRRLEANRILNMLAEVDAKRFTTKEDTFIGNMRQGGKVEPKQIFWLRDIASKYLD